jgi:hypothetical protein
VLASKRLCRAVDDLPRKLLFRVGSNCLGVVLREIGRHVELARFEVIAAAPIGNCLNLTMPAVGIHLTRQSDDKIPAIGPSHAHRAIVLVGSLQETRRDVIIWLHDLSGIGMAPEIGPGEVAERFPSGGHEPLWTQTVQI